ncbi:MAG: enoyl-ACP reductase [Gammaproteobacteria bacterium]|jgi:enoyl-[acyl-carrier protein] reductase I|nr:enoyl-[acyl-carrier-protein] reductase FabI [Chromatiales bacterium]MDP7269994.1 enoyl-ACP reductase [Gammaproteobacteria bacterium]MDP7660994.1 enoyl-ACP reductase [Gammaproteobacteria bacterium]HJP03778.1 enoyl-ACP reductase [Gammaproteobacteria bacterium]
MGFLAGKRALIVGLASKRSIAWGVADAMHREGAELAFTYQNGKLGDRVGKLAAGFDSGINIPLDVSSDEEIKNVFAELAKTWDGLDIIVHSVGFAPKELLAGRYVDSVTREGYQIAHDISAYSFAALARESLPMLRSGGALLTMTYLGAERSIPNYNVMGPAKASLEANVRFLANDLGIDNIRVNGVSAGPIRTIAASGVGNFRKLMQHAAAGNPMKRNVTLADVGNASAFLCSDLAAGITGEILHVDCGYSTVGMTFAIDEDEEVLA